MTIELICQGCAKKLRMKESDAGKSARCPSCKTVFTVPSDEHSSGFTSGAGSRFFIRSPQKGQSGPYSQRDLDSIVRDGGLTSDSEVLRDGESNWVPASALYPELAVQASGAGNSPFAERAGADTQQPDSPYPSVAAGNPYATPAAVAVTQTGRRFSKPHRGGTILAMGAASLCVCWFLGIGAFFMGMKDLAEMSKGTMDPAGRVQTVIGMTLGGFSTAINVFGFALMLIAEA